MRIVILIVLLAVALAGCGREGEGVVPPTGSPGYFPAPVATPVPQASIPTPAPSPTPCPPGTHEVEGWWGSFSCE